MYSSTLTAYELEQPDELDKPIIKHHGKDAGLFVGCSQAAIDERLSRDARSVLGCI
jgi:hypothetical protein